MAQRINGGVVLLNASMEPLGVVPLHRALVFLIRERATIVETVPGRTIRSATGEIPVPLVVAFRELVRIPYYWATAPWSRRGVLQRDNRECAYCGKRAATVDHIQPVSRGGGNSWMNTVAACVKCNSRKADKTPAEAGMTLRYSPREVTRRDTLVLALAQTGADLTAFGLVAPA